MRSEKKRDCGLLSAGRGQSDGIMRPFSLPPEGWRVRFGGSPPFLLRSNLEGTSGWAFRAARALEAIRHDRCGPIHAAPKCGPKTQPHNAARGPERPLATASVPRSPRNHGTPFPSSPGRPRFSAAIDCSQSMPRLGATGNPQKYGVCVRKLRYLRHPAVGALECGVRDPIARGVSQSEIRSPCGRGIDFAVEAS